MMSIHDPNPTSRLSRRDALTMGVAAAGGLAGAIIGGCAAPGAGGSSTVPGMRSLDSVTALGPPGADLSRNVIRTIEDIIKAQGMYSNGVLSIEIDRDDISGVTLHGVPILPSFEINGSLNFQCLGGDDVAMNSDRALKASELDPFIDQLIAHDIVFQAEHQHFYDFSPLVWFIHFRATGDATRIARGIKAALNVTSTPFPQKPPSNPKTPLPAEESATSWARPLQSEPMAS